MVAWEVQHVILLPLELSRRYRAPSWFHIRPLPGKQFWVSVALPHLDVATARSGYKEFQTDLQTNLSASLWQIFTGPFTSAVLGQIRTLALKEAGKEETPRPFVAIRPEFGLCDRGKMFYFGQFCGILSSLSKVLSMFDSFFVGFCAESFAIYLVCPDGWKTVSDFCRDPGWFPSNLVPHLSSNLIAFDCSKAIAKHFPEFPFLGLTGIT